MHTMPPRPFLSLQGGRHRDLILREDQLLAKAHRLRARKKEKEELDPFAPEYGEDTWHKVGPAACLPVRPSVRLAGWLAADSRVSRLRTGIQA